MRLIYLINLIIYTVYSERVIMVQLETKKKYKFICLHTKADDEEF